MSTWPQWGTGTGTDAGRIIEVSNWEEQRLAEADNWPARLIWFSTAKEAETYAQKHNPNAYKAWQRVVNSPGEKQIIAGAASALNTGTNAINKSFSISLGPLGKITDPLMWRSLGWLLLGLLLMVTGLWLWIKQYNVLPNAVPVPV